MTRAEKIEAAARALSRVLGEVATTDPTVRWNMKSAVALSDAQRDLTTALAASPEVKPTGEGALTFGVHPPSPKSAESAKAIEDLVDAAGRLLQQHRDKTATEAASAGERYCECCTGTEECCRCDDDCATGRARLAAGRDSTDCRPLPAPASEARCEECGGTGRCTCDGCKTDGKERACRTCGGTGGAREGTK